MASTDDPGEPKQLLFREAAQVACRAQVTPIYGTERRKTRLEDKPDKRGFPITVIRLPTMPFSI